VDQLGRGRPGRGRLAEPQAVRADRRRGESARLDGARPRHQRQRRRDEYVEPDQPVDPAKDKRVGYALYAVAVSPADGTLWGTATGYPGAVLRVVPGADPASTALTEVYEPPAPIAFGPRGGDVDASGVYWVSLASGHLGSFDRRKCRVLNGPEATGRHCPRAGRSTRSPGRSCAT